MPENYVILWLMQKDHLRIFSSSFPHNFQVNKMATPECNNPLVVVNAKLAAQGVPPLNGSDELAEFFQVNPVGEGWMGRDCVSYEKYTITAGDVTQDPGFALTMGLRNLIGRVYECFLVYATKQLAIDVEELPGYVGGFPDGMQDEDKMNAIFAHVNRQEVIDAAEATLGELARSHKSMSIPDDCTLSLDDTAVLFGIAKRTVEWFGTQLDSELESVLDDAIVSDLPAKRRRVTGDAVTGDPVQPWVSPF